jgi:hypothetical protein
MQLHLLFDLYEDLPTALQALASVRAIVASPTPPRRLLGRVRFAPAPIERRAAS